MLLRLLDDTLRTSRPIYLVHIPTISWPTTWRSVAYLVTMEWRHCTIVVVVIIIVIRKVVSNLHKLSAIRRMLVF